MLMFFRPGYLMCQKSERFLSTLKSLLFLTKHPQCFIRKNSTNVLAFFIFLACLVTIVITPSVLSTTCGDKQCYKGYDTVNVTLNFLGEFFMEGVLKSNQSSNYTLEGETFLIKLLSVDRGRNKANIQINTTQALLGVGWNISFKNLTLVIKEIVTAIDSEEPVCPQDCLEGTFVKIGDQFALGSGLCKGVYRFLNTNQENYSILLRKDDRIIELAYDINSSNIYGAEAILSTKVYDATVNFHMRYNNNTKLIRLEDFNQTCPIIEKCSSNLDCDDNKTCTIDECQLIGCAHKLIRYCKSGDGCCPARCILDTDSDCGIYPTTNFSLLDANATLVVYNLTSCTINESCNDNNSCTLDVCFGETNRCVNTPITACGFGDGCCPNECNSTADNDCPNIVLCGDKKCELNETKENCCMDCGCNVDLECLGNACIKSKKKIAEEAVDKDNEFREKQKKLFLDKYALKEKIFLESNGSFNFEYSYAKGDKEAVLSGKVDEIGQIYFMAPEKPMWYNVLKILLVVIPILFGGIRLSQSIKKKKKEEYYKKLLQQRYAQRNVQPLFNHQYRGIHGQNMPTQPANQRIRQHPVYNQSSFQQSRNQILPHVNIRNQQYNQINYSQQQAMPANIKQPLQQKQTFQRPQPAQYTRK